MTDSGYRDCQKIKFGLQQHLQQALYGHIRTNETRLNAQEIQVNQCSFTRNQLPDTVQDYSEVVRGTKFEDDLVFLKNNFESKVDDKNELKAKKYENLVFVEKMLRPNRKSKLCFFNCL